METVWLVVGGLIILYALYAFVRSIWRPGTASRGEAAESSLASSSGDFGSHGATHHDGSGGHDGGGHG